ncbi:MAG: hypothetical protein ABSF67_06550 [Roseiarcus sp.]|jgi:hypothetical protein
MIERKKLSAQKIEARRLEALHRRLGLKHISHVKIGPYSGPKNWTWDLLEAGPGASVNALRDAIEDVRKLQQEFDLDVG